MISIAFFSHFFSLFSVCSLWVFEKKRFAIFKHQSQKDRPVFPGDDAREFWVRAEDRTRETAKAYDHLGLAEYEAMEAFVRYKY